MRPAAPADALERAVKPAFKFHPYYKKNKETSFLFEQVFHFLHALPPEGQKSVFALTERDTHGVKIWMQASELADLRAQLKASGRNPDELLPSGTNGVTLMMTQKQTGEKTFLVLIASDKILGTEALKYPLSDRQRNKALAKLSALLSHELYGHVYLYLFGGLQEKPRREQEIYAYGQSAAFLKRLAARPELKEIPALQQAVETEANYELLMQKKWLASPQH